MLRGGHLGALLIRPLVICQGAEKPLRVVGGFPMRPIVSRPTARVATRPEMTSLLDDNLDDPFALFTKRMPGTCLQEQAPESPAVGVENRLAVAHVSNRSLDTNVGPLVVSGDGYLRVGMAALGIRTCKIDNLMAKAETFGPNTGTHFLVSMTTEAGKRAIHVHVIQGGFLLAMPALELRAVQVPALREGIPPESRGHGWHVYLPLLSSRPESGCRCLAQRSPLLP